MECYKLALTISGMGILDMMMPKTYLWFYAKSPHYLVRFKGAIGPPGSGEFEYKFLEYSK